ncbi:MAG: protein-ADP-ribose hydrolase [Atopobiaceae bacterium]|nr:protein-ADP-ribose hydrolase [Atopobiaceae bacterium]MBQ6523319.1 protein-ADP-ribose hydrolase [Atopobiaceae bacterium]
MTEKRKRELLLSLIPALCDERGVELGLGEDAATDELFSVFRALVNTRPPVPADPGWLSVQDELLQGMIAEAGVTRVEDIPPVAADPRLRLWRGDITTLTADAIVNAANSQMLGCWAPGHHCIDNAIHTFAGVQLRAECARIMDAQGHEEPTGLAKITPAYNLPSRHVIHTVGPIAQGRPTARHRLQLAQCYRSCLDLAAKGGLRSVAFCCISTGIFGFPQVEAAQIAVRTVREWLDAHEGSGVTVVFNVFGDVDEAIYGSLLS